MTAFVVDNGAAVPIDLATCGVCSAPAMAFQPGTAPLVDQITGITISPGTPGEAWCFDHWPWRNCRGPYQLDFISSLEPRGR